MKDKEKPKAYIRVDDDGQYEETDDPRDALADEMVSLKERKLAGEEEQRRLRRETAARGLAPSGRSVRTTSNRSTFFPLMMITRTPRFARSIRPWSKTAERFARTHGRSILLNIEPAMKIRTFTTKKTTYTAMATPAGW